MRLATLLMYDGNPRKAADDVVALERAGLDSVWVAEAYGFDSPTLMGYLAAKTETVQIGSGILNIYSRTPGALLQTAAGLDNVSGSRLRPLRMISTTSWVRAIGLAYGTPWKPSITCGPLTPRPRIARPPLTLSRPAAVWRRAPGVRE